MAVLRTLLRSPGVFRAVLSPDWRCLQRVCSIHTAPKHLKLPKSTIEALKRWNLENHDVYGPLLKPSGKSTTSESEKLSVVKKQRKSRKGTKKAAKEQTLSTTSNDHGQIESTYNESVEGIKHDVDIRDASTQTLIINNEGAYNNADTAMGASVVYTDPETTVDLSGLDGILSFPLFPPDKTEYYVNPPQLPTINIPGQSERAAFEKPFFPSVGTILSATQTIQSRIALKKWQDNLVKELGVEGFKQHKKEILRRGVEFHECVQSNMEGTPISEVVVSAENQGYWNSAQRTLSEVDQVTSTEKMVIHRDLCYRGQYDCLAQFRGQLVLIDWKTSKRAKSDIRYTYDNPLQVAAYVGAHNFTKDVDSMVDKALIVVCYEDGQPADTHLLSRRMCVDYWSQWLQRLHQYWTQKLSV